MINSGNYLKDRKALQNITSSTCKPTKLHTHSKHSHTQMHINSDTFIITHYNADDIIIFAWDLNLRT